MPTYMYVYVHRFIYKSKIERERERHTHTHRAIERGLKPTLKAVDFTSFQKPKFNAA